MKEIKKIFIAIFISFFIVIAVTIISLILINSKDENLELDEDKNFGLEECCSCCRDGEEDCIDACCPCK